jgi:hypothetical protein
MPPFQFPRQTGVRRLERGLSEVIIVGAIVLPPWAQALAEVVAGEKGLVRVTPEAVYDAGEPRGHNFVIIGFTSAVAAAGMQRVLLELEGVEGVEFDVAMGSHGLRVCLALFSGGYAMCTRAVGRLVLRHSRSIGSIWSVRSLDRLSAARNRLDRADFDTANGVVCMKRAAAGSGRLVILGDGETRGSPRSVLWRGVSREGGAANCQACLPVSLVRLDG